MRILFLSPQPLYQDRGSSIANKLIIEVLSERGEETDVITYAEGKTIEYPHIRLMRTPDYKFLRGIRPGFSIKKIIGDFFMFLMVIRLLMSGKRYDVIHAVEESAFIALFFKWFLRVPYIYDMDSSLAQQMIEKYPSLKFLSTILDFFEGLAIRNANAVIVVCDALGEIAMRHNPKKLVTLRDVPLLDDEPVELTEDLRDGLGIEGPMLMYVGNLESYQGIDLLVESVARAVNQTSQPFHTVVVGGADADIEKYKAMAGGLGLADRMHFIGPRPIGDLKMYLSQADVLLSPRTKGNNTPMKIYSYLYSGKPIVATDLWTHTQVLTTDVSVLAEPTPEAYASGLVRLIEDAALRNQLGQAGKLLIEQQYSYEVFHTTLTELLDWLESKVGSPPADVVASGAEA